MARMQWAQRVPWQSPRGVRRWRWRGNEKRIEWRMVSVTPVPWA